MKADILAAVTKHFDLSADALASRERSPKLAQARRVATELLIAEGYSGGDVATELGVHRVTVYRWHALFSETRDHPHVLAILEEMAK